jgi:hypothetical protein
MGLSRIKLSAVAAVVVLSGCSSGQIVQPPNPAVAPSTVSWDGTYRGAIQITGTGSGIQQRWCETDPKMVVQVTNNSFRYAMPHPNAPDNPTPVYSATIAPDGTFYGQLQSGTMHGRITGSRMSGTVDGSVCVYAFSMDRS